MSVPEPLAHLALEAASALENAIVEVTGDTRGIAAHQALEIPARVSVHRRPEAPGRPDGVEQPAQRGARRRGEQLGEVQSAPRTAIRRLAGGRYPGQAYCRHASVTPWFPGASGVPPEAAAPLPAARPR